MSESPAVANLAMSVVAQFLFYYTHISPLLPTYLHLLLGALLPIITGAHASLSRPSNTHLAEKIIDTGDNDDDPEDIETAPLSEKLSNWDAIIFPVTAGTALLALYLIIKYASAVMLNKILAIYFTLMGIFAVGQLYRDGLAIVHDFVFPKSWQDRRGALWIVKGTFVAENDINGQKSDSATVLPFGNLYGWLLGARIRAFIARIRTASMVRWNLTITTDGKKGQDLYVRFGYTSLLGYLFSIVTIAIYYFWPDADKPWYLTNILGTAFSYTAVQLLSPTSFPTASLIMGALFFYDIFFVFYTPLMVSVATQLDVPIKMLFPRSQDSTALPGSKPPLAMLGLGDIVLPGIVIGLALRFDLWRHYERKRLEQIDQLKQNTMEGSVNEKIIKCHYERATGSWGTRFWTGVVGKPLSSGTQKWRHGGNFPKPYFCASIVGYIMGMMATIGVMHVFSHAQPALLYLVPGVLISLWGMGFAKGELVWLWSWSEAEEETEPEIKPKVTMDEQIGGKEEDRRTLAVQSDHSLNLESVYQRWKTHKTVNPSGTQYASLLAALSAPTPTSNRIHPVQKDGLKVLLKKEQEPIYDLLSALIRKEAGIDGNPFAYSDVTLEKLKASEKPISRGVVPSSADSSANSSFMSTGPSKVVYKDALREVNPLISDGL